MNFLFFIMSGQDPVFTGRVPDDLRIASIVFEYRVVPIIGECPPAVITIGKTLATVGIRKDGDKCGFLSGLKPGAIRLIDNRTSGKAPATGHRPGEDRAGKLLPVDQVLAHSMSPGHVVRPSAHGVVLEVKVPLAIVVDQTVRVIGPSNVR